jgi:hypothetical protein
MPEKSIAIAIHPVDDYLQKPAQAAIQQILDDPKYDLTIGVQFPLEAARKAGRMNTLYVTPDVTIATPQWTSTNEFPIIDPDQILGLLSNDMPTQLSITLIGGEVPGCHSGALYDLNNWFPTSPLQELTVEAPFNALFAGNSLDGLNNDEPITLEYVRDVCSNEYTIAHAFEEYHPDRVVYRFKK